MKQSGFKSFKLIFVLMISIPFSIGHAASVVAAPAATFVPDANADVGVTAPRAKDAVTPTSSTSDAIEQENAALAGQAQEAYIQNNMAVSTANVTDAAAAAAAAQAQATIDAANAATKQQQNASMIQALAGVCPLALENLFKGSNAQQIQKTADDTEDIAYQSMASPSFYKNMNHDTAATVGAAISTNMPAGCSNFISKDGKLGQWGQWALTKIQAHPESFGEKVPRDIAQYCPKYTSMNEDQRNLYWVWIMASMASSESNCSERNAAGTNGTAYGIFQLEYNKCPGARNLDADNQNIDCAVNILSKEMDNRNEVTTDHSNNKTGTYWGTLRDDDNNSKRGGDIIGGLKTRALMSQYTYCH